jgi:transposase
MSISAIYRRCIVRACFLLHWKGRTEMSMVICLLPKLFTFWIMKKIESEQLSKRVVTFYNNEGSRVMKLTAAHFKKEKVPERTIYNIISKYLKYNTTEFRPKNGRPRKISNQQLQSLVKSVQDRVGVSQRRLARRFNVSQSTISRNLKTRTSVRIYKRRSAPKYTSTDQEHEPE